MTTQSVTERNQILINGVRFPLNQRLTRQLVSSYPPKIVTGDTTRDSRPDTSLYAQSNWTGGIGIERAQGARDVDRIWWGTMDLSHERHLVLPPRVQTLPLLPAAGVVTALGEFEGFIYVTFNRDVYKYDPVAGWGSSLHSVLGTPRSMEAISVGTTRYFVLTHDEGFAHTTDGSTWTDIGIARDDSGDFNLDANNTDASAAFILEVGGTDYLFVGDSVDDRIRAYTLGGVRTVAQDLTNITPDDLQGTAVSDARIFMLDGTEHKVYVTDHSGSREQDLDFDLEYATDPRPTGIAVKSDNRTILVADALLRKTVAYQITGSEGSREASRDFSPTIPGSVQHIAARDGLFWGLSSTSDRDAYCFNSSGARQSQNDLQLPVGGEAEFIASDGATIWIYDSVNQVARAYDLINISNTYAINIDNTNNTVHLYELETTNGNLTEIGSGYSLGNRNWLGASAVQVGQTLYVILLDIRDPDSVHLYRLNVSTGNLTEIGNGYLIPDRFWQGLGAVLVGETVYIILTNVDDDISQLYTINVATGVLSTVGSAQALGAGTWVSAGLAVLGDTTYAALVDNDDFHFYTLNVNDGSLQEIGGGVDLGNGDWVGGDLLTVGNTVYFAASDSDNDQFYLYTVDTATGGLTEIEAGVSLGNGVWPGLALFSYSYSEWQQVDSKDYSLHAADDDPEGMIADDEKVFVWDGDDSTFYEYPGGATRALPLAGITNLEPKSFVVADDKLYALATEGGTRQWVAWDWPARTRSNADDFNSGSGLTDADGAAFLDNRLWQSTGNTLYAYSLVSSIEVQRFPASDFNLDADNADPHGLTVQGGKVYCADDSALRIFAYTEAGNRDSNSDKTLSPDNHTPRALVATDDHFYIPDSGENKVFRELKEATTSALPGIVSVVHWDDKAWGITKAGALYQSSDLANGWTEAAVLPPHAAPITDMFIFRNGANEQTIHAMTAIGLYVYDADNDKWLATEVTFPRHEQNGQGSTIWRSELYIPVGLSIYRYTGGSSPVLSLVGPDRDQGVPWEGRSQIRQLYPSHNSLLAGIENLEASGAEGSSHVLSWDTVGWQSLWSPDAGTLLTNLLVTSAYGRYSAWFSYGSRVAYINLPRDIINPSRLDPDREYQDSAYILTPWFNADEAEVDKVALEVKVEVDNLSESETIDVVMEYVQDGDESSITFPTITTGGLKRFPLPSSDNPEGIIFQRMRWRVTGNRGSDATLSPDLQMIGLEYVKVLDTKWGYIADVDLNQEFDGQSKEQLAAHLEDAARQRELVPIVYRPEESDGSQVIYANVERVSFREDTGADATANAIVVLSEI